MVNFTGMGMSTGLARGGIAVEEHGENLIRTRPLPAFGRQGLVGSSGGYTYHRYTSHTSPRACGARLGQIVKSVEKWEKRNFSCL